MIDFISNENLIIMIIGSFLYMLSITLSSNSYKNKLKTVFDMDNRPL